MPTIEFRDAPVSGLYSTLVFRDGIYFGTVYPDVHSLHHGEAGNYWVAYDIRPTVQVFLSYPVMNADGIATYPEGGEVSYWARPNEVVKSIREHAALEYRPF